MKIGIVIGSVREGRNGKQVGDWIYEQALKRTDASVTYELVDLKEYDLPLMGTKESADIARWSEKMASFDGYVFITAEYNRLVPGAFKNALDYLKPEVQNKAVAFVGYGGFGGLAAIESLRVATSEQQLAGVQAQVNFLLTNDFENMNKLVPKPYHEKSLNNMLDQLLSWSKALKGVRQG